MISGVLVPEIVEEINDAYDDLLLDIGKYNSRAVWIVFISTHDVRGFNISGIEPMFIDTSITILHCIKDLSQTSEYVLPSGLANTEAGDESEEDFLPSCLPLLLLDYIFLNISSAFDKFKNKR